MIIALEAMLGVVATFITVGGVGVKWIMSAISTEGLKREAAFGAIIASINSIKEDVGQSTKRIEEVEKETRGYRSGKQIDEDIDHAKRNFQQSFQHMQSVADQQSLSMGMLRDRVTVLETKHEAVATAVNDLKVDIKDMRSEINDRFDTATKATQSQFEKLFTVIRETSQPAK